MSTNYQSLHKYKGSMYGEPKHQGIEYDWEVADNQVIGSAGGVSGIHHHYTKGMYSKASSSSDIYAGEPLAYPAAEFGNIYQPGHSAPYHIGMFKPPVDKMYPSTSLYRKDNFAPGMEMIPPPDNTTVSTPSSGATTQTNVPEEENGGKPSLNVFAVFLLLLLLWFAIAFWTIGGEKFLVAKVHNGVSLNWKWYLFYAVVFTVIFFIAANFSGIPVMTLEGV